MKKYIFRFIQVFALLLIANPSFAVSSLCNVGHPSMDVQYNTVYHKGSWDALDYLHGGYIYMSSTVHAPVYANGPLLFEIQNQASSLTVYRKNPANGMWTVSGSIFAGEPGPDAFYYEEYDYCTPPPGTLTFNVNNTPGVSVSISPNPPVAAGTNVTIYWGTTNNASACSYNGGTPLPDVTGNISFIATSANAIQYNVMCLGPVGEDGYGPLGSIGSGSATLTLTCGAQSIIDEYATYSATPVPSCSDFKYFHATYNFSPNFQWKEYNGNWSSGNPNPNWGMIKSATVTGLEATRTNYGRPIVTSSGYRSPAGNNAVGGVTNSHHVHGRAIDMFSLQSSYPWTEAEFNLLKAAAEATSPAPNESFPWNTYTDHHYHAAW